MVERGGGTMVNGVLFSYPHSAKIVKNLMRNAGGEIDKGKDARYDCVIHFMCLWSF